MELKRIGAFFALLAYIIGAIGGIGYCLYIKEWFVAICLVVVAAMAFPTAKKFAKLFDLSEEGKKKKAE